MRCQRLLWVGAVACLLAGEIAAGENPARPGSVTVHVVARTNLPGGKSGGSCAPVRVTAEESADGQPRVGFFETEVGGTGAQWRSNGWMAAVTAALLSDFDPRTTRVSIEYEGIVDGPSAGAVLTVAVLAAARGDQVRPDAAMTGTINPDGSIGPVGGISHKIDGAAASGMKLLLIPAGIRFDQDANTGERVDLLEYGEQKGVEVRNVFDLYEAYKLLTGTELPRPDSSSSLRVTLVVQKRTREKIVAWVERYQQALTKYGELDRDEEGAEQIENVYKLGVDRIKQGQVLLNEGEFTPALWDCVIGTACGYLALEAARCRNTYATRGYAGLVERLRDNAWLEGDVKKMSERLRNETPRTLEQLSVYLVACDAFLEALSLQHLAKARLAALPADESAQAIGWAGSAAEEQIMAWLDLKLTGDYLDLAVAYQGTPIPAQVPWNETASYFYHASRANMAVFDTTIVEPKAKALSLSADDFRALLLANDKAYAIVFTATGAVFPALSNHFGDGEAMKYANLAASVYVHTRAAGLLAKYYSLGAELNEYQQVVSIPHERLLGEWLTFAEDQSRRNIALLQDSGFDATVSAQMHAIARIKARRDLHEKLEGLVAFWSADAHARILRRLSGLAQRQEANAAQGAPSGTKRPATGSYSRTRPSSN